MKTERTSENRIDTGKGARTVVRISVRQLVEFLLRSGDIDDSLSAGMNTEAMAAGARAHRRIQKSRKSGYASEVSLVKERAYDGFSIRLEGRADGIFEKGGDGVPVIEEIKGMYTDVSAMEAPVPVHLAQAACYAAMYLRQTETEEPDTATSDEKPFEKNETFREKASDEQQADADGWIAPPSPSPDACGGAGDIQVRMTYVNLDTEETRFFDFSYEKASLFSWFGALLDSFSVWAAWLTAHAEKRDASISPLTFPFPFRTGQKRLVAAVWKAVTEGKELFLMAPTGVGKTMACLYPAVRAVGAGEADRIFYLTAKNETRISAVEAFRILSEEGLQMCAVVITAKEKVCPLHEPVCSPRSCPYAKGHYDRINRALYACLVRGALYDRAALLEAAEAWKICPYALSLDLTNWCDLIIGDYNYAFDPDAALGHYFEEGKSGSYILLVDEAHNLVERGRRMYSASLEKAHLLAAKRKLPTGTKLAKNLAAVNKKMLALSHTCENGREISPDELGPVALAAQSLMDVFGSFFRDNRDGALRESLLDVYFEVRDFVNAALRADERYLAWAGTDPEEGSFSVSIRCMNPANELTARVRKGKSAIFFSATLLPVSYYRKLLTTETESPAVYIPSPFDMKNRLLLVASDVDTRYRMRTETMYGRIADYLYEMAMGRRGNYLAFFSSYQMMRDAFSAFRERYGTCEIDWVVQSPGMTEEDREIFLENFQEHPARSLLGFCVMGGVFAEGIDLAGEKLIGAAVVGCGLPQVSEETEMVKRYFDENGENGFDFAYRFPGMNKVQQSAGRVIRTMEDRGVILLLDSRFLAPSYQKLFPAEWREYDVCTVESAAGKLADFWGK